MSRQSDLKHALHNEEVFLHLLPNEKFADWIVNTAFYAALHFVDYKIFPLTFSERGIQIKIDDIDSYAVSMLNKHNNDKHVCRIKLVETKLRPIAYEFNWLFSACKNARYNDFNFTDPQKTCELAKKHLAAIKDFCYPVK